MVDDPLKQEPAQAAEYSPKKVHRNAEFGLENSLVEPRHPLCRPVANRSDNHCRYAADEGACPEVTVLGDIQVVGGHRKDLRQDVCRHDKTSYQYRADHQDPEHGGIYQVDEYFCEQVRYTPACVRGARPRGETFRVRLLRYSRRCGSDNLNVLGAFLRIIFLPVPMGFCFMFTEGIFRAKILRLGQEKDSSQRAHHVERQFGDEKTLVPLVLKHDATDDRYHGRHASQRADNDRRPPSSFVEEKHVPHGRKRKALPGRDSETLDQPTCKQGVVIGVLGANNANDGPESAGRRSQKKLRPLAILLCQYGD